MSEARWIEVCVKTSPARVDAVAEALTQRGITGLVLEDEADFHRFLEENRRLWDYVDEELYAAMRGLAQVKFYVPEGELGEGVWRAAVAGLPEEGQVTAALLDETDWGNAYKRYYHPFAVGERLYIIPAWLTATPPEGRIPMRLNPGLTFGTGTHATTRLCLTALERYLTPGQAALDLGCGSGILSVAALLLGADSAVAVDIDPKAVNAAYENAALNGIGTERYTVLSGDVLSDGGAARRVAAQKYPLIVANIVADVIIALAPAVRAWLAPGGVFLCCGILDTRAEEVRTALEGAGWHILARADRDDWVLFAAE